MKARIFLVSIALIAMILSSVFSQQPVRPLSKPLQTPSEIHIPNASVPLPPNLSKEKSLDQLLDEMDQLLKQKAEIAKKESELIKVIQSKAEQQADRMKRIGIKIALPMEPQVTN